VKKPRIAFSDAAIAAIHHNLTIVSRNVGVGAKEIYRASLAKAASSNRCLGAYIWWQI
jgi:hypothetical protein